MSVQGLLDLVLEISVDLSSTSTSTPVQPPSTIDGSKVTSNAAPEGLKAMTMSVIVKGHASLSKLATAKLTGMSSQVLLKNDSGVNALRGSGLDSLSLPVPMGDGMCSSLTVHESVVLINTALSTFKCRHSSSSSSGDEEAEAHDGTDADFYKTVSAPDTSIHCNTLTAPPPRPAEKHLHTEQHTHSTKSHPLDTPSHPSLSHLPISVRLGAVGHVCHQAAVTALSILSLSSSECPSSSSSSFPSREHSMSSKCDADVTALESLLLLVFDAYRTVGSIGVEDSFLEEAADAAEQLLRGQQDASKKRCNSRSEDVSADLGPTRCRQISDSHHSVHRLTDSTLGASYGAAVRDNDRGRRGNQGLSFSTSSSSVLRGGDRTGSSSVSGGNGVGVGVGVPLYSGNMDWSDDSSDASENDSTYHDDVTITHTRTLLPSSLKSRSRSRFRPLDLFSLAVQNLPEGVKGIIERYDLHCHASEVFITEFDGSTTGAYVYVWL